MINTLGKSAFFLLLLFLRLQEGRAQYVWHKVMPGDGWRYGINFIDISCNGNDCLVSGKALDRINDYKVNIYLTSHDAGVTWNIGLFPTNWGLNSDRLVHNIQIIDKENYCAVGDSGLIMRSNDGGKNWMFQDCGTKIKKLVKVHFSDAYSGIIIAYTSDSNNCIYTTSDGGVNWHSKTLAAPYLYSCHTYSKDQYSVFSRSLKKVISTNDNWATKTFSAPIIDSLQDSEINMYTFYGCRFFDKDTIIAYGLKNGKGGVVVRSIDGGRTWEHSHFSQTLSGIVDVFYSNRDTVIAVGGTGTGHSGIFMSTNSGYSWIDTSITLASLRVIHTIQSIAWTNQSPVALIDEVDPAINATAYGDIELPFLPRNSVFMKDENIHSESIFPNPATSEIMLNGFPAYQSFSLFDIFGRELIKGKTDETGSSYLDVSSLVNGAYFIYLGKGNNERFFEKLFIQK